jgi:hypothetical protein
VQHLSSVVTLDMRTLLCNWSLGTLSTLLRRDIRWYLARRAQLPAPLQSVVAAAERAVAAQPWLHRTALWVGGTVRSPQLQCSSPPCYSHMHIDAGRRVACRMSVAKDY